MRDSNIELFRIVTMLLIIAHHYVMNSGLTEASGPLYADPLAWRTVFLLLIRAWGKTGINCFILITGYYMCRSRITVKKFAKLLLEIQFYRVLIHCVFCAAGYQALSVMSLIKVLIPVTKLGTGFTNAYLLLYLSIPFLNLLIGKMTEKQHLRLIALEAFVFIFLGTVPGFSVTLNYLSWFIALYFIAAYIRLYPKKLFGSHTAAIWLSVISVALSALSVVACLALGARTGQRMAYAFVMDSNTFLAVFTAVSLFLLFKNCRIGHSRPINFIAASTFGVFLIHTMGDSMRQWLWNDTLDVVGHYGVSWMPLHAVGAVLAIFIVCTAIDKLRIYLLEKPFFKFWDVHWNDLASRFGVLEAKILAFLDVRQ